MTNLLIQMGLLIACGIAWRLLRPGGLSVDAVREALTACVYYLMLPALVLSVLWRAPLSQASLVIAPLAASGVLVSLALTWCLYRLFRPADALLGAMLLAAAWPNATYLGLPVLDAVYGEYGRRIAIQYDLFACTPLLMTVGVSLAGRYGRRSGGRYGLMALFRVPPLWAALIAVILNLGDIDMPQLVDDTLQMLGHGVVPLILVSLGISLRWDSLRWRNLPLVVPALLVQLIMMPLIVWGLGQLLSVDGRLLTALVLEAAMPSMLLGLVISERYGLDTASYAATTTLSTMLSMITLPLWHAVLTG